MKPEKVVVERGRTHIQGRSSSMLELLKAVGWLDQEVARTGRRQIKHQETLSLAEGGWGW